MTVPSAADLASAMAFLDARIEPGQALVRGNIAGRGLAESIVAIASDLGWQPPDPPTEHEASNALRAASDALQPIVARLEAALADVSPSHGDMQRIARVMVRDLREITDDLVHGRSTTREACDQLRHLIKAYGR